MVVNLFFYFTLLLFGVTSKAEYINLDIASGTILGRTGYTTGLDRLWYMFQGIPYAEPPQRFELPVEKQPWEEIIDCTHDKPQCVQGTDIVSGSEDCLTLSVYSPNLSGSYPVLVWVHGGYFTQGNASYQNQAPDFIVEEGVVFVEIQYRLGVFGFMSTGDLSCPGNLGFKDQVLALQWVQKNIAYFGGDPTRVTLGGQSAGAASVALPLQSPKSQGLFQATILNSATSLCLWALNRRARAAAFETGASLGIVTLDSTKLVQELKTKNYVDLQKNSMTIATLNAAINPLAGIYFGYVPEPDHPDAFFTGRSEQLLTQGQFAKVPQMLGFTSNEFIGFGNISAMIRAYLLTYDFVPTRLPPEDLTNDLLKRLPAGIEIRSHFFPLGAAISKDETISTFVNVDQFERPIRQFGLDVSKYVTETYFYKFSYFGPLGGEVYRQSRDVGHGEDLNYLFKKNISVTQLDELIRSRMVRLWSNFVKYHKPTPFPETLLQNQVWSPIGGANGNLNYFNINSTLSLLTNPSQNHMALYDRIYEVYGSGNYDTY